MVAERFNNLHFTYNQYLFKNILWTTALINYYFNMKRNIIISYSLWISHLYTKILYTNY